MYRSVVAITVACCAIIGWAAGASASPSTVRYLGSTGNGMPVTLVINSVQCFGVGCPASPPRYVEVFDWGAVLACANGRRVVNEFRVASPKRLDGNNFSLGGNLGRGLSYRLRGVAHASVASGTIATTLRVTPAGRPSANGTIICNSGAVHWSARRGH
jgi:hypothetical protein